MSNKIILISGPSGVGKRTIIEQFINLKELNLSYSVSMTTRPKRDNEINGRDYYFVSENEFNQAIKNNEMVEWAEFCNNKYGTRKSELKRILGNQKNVLLEIEIQGALAIFDMFNREEYISIFIAPPSIEELEKRLMKRATESPTVIKDRIETAKEELKFQNKYDYVVTNHDVCQAVAEIIKIIKGVQSE